MINRPKRKPRNFALAFVGVGLSATLVACGGGGGSGSGATAPATSVGKSTAVYFTDDFSAEYDAVWITVTRVAAVSPIGETQLAAFDPGRLINLPTLRRTGALMTTAAIPAGATSVRVYVGTAARLQQLDGSMRDVSLAAPSGYLEFRLEGWNAASGALALDFDLPKFSLQGNTLVPATRVASNNDYAGWDQRYAEVEGNVIAVSATTLTLDTKHFGQRVFTLDSNTTYVSRRSVTWKPAIGDKIEIRSAVTGQGTDALQFTARSVKDESSGAATSLWKVEGMVTAVSGTKVTATIRRSESFGATGPVTFDIASATFKRGSAASVVPGVKIEAYLDQQGPSWVASAIEIEGAAKTGDSSTSSNRRDYAEVKGHVVSYSGNTVVVHTTYTERMPGVVIGTSLSLDLANAYFEKGGSSCIVAGVPIELKGFVDAAGVLRPVKVEVEGGCASASPVAGVTPPGKNPAPAGAVFVEAKGTVTAVRSGEFDLSVYRMEYAGTSPAAVTVRYDATTFFKRTSPGQIGTGGFVEVKGSMLGSILTAAKVELE